MGEGMTPRRDPPKVKDLAEGMILAGRYVHACKRCGELFIARKDAKMCSNACRVAASRAKN